MNKPEFTDDAVTAEREEFERLAELLAKRFANEDPEILTDPREVVKFIIDNYRPRVVWSVIEPDPSEPVYLQTTFYVCQLRVGGRLFKYRFPWIIGRQHPLDDGAWAHLRRQMIGKLGEAVGRWADGEEDAE